MPLCPGLLATATVARNCLRPISIFLTVFPFVTFLVQRRLAHGDEAGGGSTGGSTDGDGGEAVEELTTAAAAALPVRSSPGWKRYRLEELRGAACREYGRWLAGCCHGDGSSESAVWFSVF